MSTSCENMGFAAPPHQRKGRRPPRRAACRMANYAGDAARRVAEAEVPKTEKPRRDVRPGQWQEAGGCRVGRPRWILSKSGRRRRCEGRRPTLVCRRYRRPSTPTGTRPRRLARNPQPWRARESTANTIPRKLSPSRHELIRLRTRLVLAASVLGEVEPV